MRLPVGSQHAPYKFRWRGVPQWCFHLSVEVYSLHVIADDREVHGGWIKIDGELNDILRVKRLDISFTL